ncbi:hypothetical protein AB0O91_00040 [Kitasatospora sp. NPDC089797]|uniref:hypothetical protein n=1 Tax=Kitasatospora sp. NPDC089797 TaxID=3155298 RepID=UPI003427BD46
MTSPRTIAGTPAPAATGADRPLGPLPMLPSPPNARGGRTRIPAERDSAGPDELSAATTRTGVPAALLVSTTVPRTGVRATRNSGRPAVTCSYLDASFTRAEQAVPLLARGPQVLLEEVLPGAVAGTAQLGIGSTFHPALVAAARGWRAYALQAHGVLLLVVVPDRPGVGTVPHLHLVGPAARVPGAGEAA